MFDRAIDPDHLMSIETLLTLGLTAAILIAAFVLRLVVLSVLRVALHLAGKDASWLRPQRVPRTDRAERPLRRAGAASALRPRLLATGRRARSGLVAAGGPARSGLAAAGAGARSGLAAVGAAVIAAAATVWTGAVRGAADLESWADRTNRRLAPAVREISAAARRSSADIAKYLVAGIATVQHVVLLLAGWLRSLVSGPQPSTPAASEPGRVIDLDRDDDAAGRSTSRRSESVGV